MPSVQASVDAGLYRCFLLLARLCPGEPLVPSPRIDHVWHAHMLDTEAYVTDCRRLLGGILCHRTSRRAGENRRPVGGETGFARTCRLAAERLGVDFAVGLQMPGSARTGHGWRKNRWDHPAAVLLREAPAADRFMTVTEVAEVTRLSKPTIYRLIDSGDLEAIRIGGTLRVPESALSGRLPDGRRTQRGTGG